MQHAYEARILSHRWLHLVSLENNNKYPPPPRHNSSLLNLTFQNFESLISTEEDGGFKKNNKL